MSVTNYVANLTPGQLAEITAFAGTHQSLHDVLQWAQRGQPGMVPAVISRAVIQDEYSHDIVVPWNGLVLVYGAT